MYNWKQTNKDFVALGGEMSNLKANYFYYHHVIGQL
jgi:hypothetical protein